MRQKLAKLCKRIIDFVEEIITAKVVSVDTPPKLNPHKVIINMDKPRPKYNHGINFYK